MNKVVPILIVATLAASVACMHLVRELRQERARSETLQSQLEEQQKEILALRAQDAPQFQTQLHEKPKTASPSKPASTLPAPASAAKLAEAADSRAMFLQARENMQSERQRLQDPEYRSAMQAQMRASLGTSYPGLASELGITREEAGHLLDLLASQQVADMEDSTFYGSEQPDPAAVEEIQRQIQQRHRQHQMEIEVQLGPATYAKWQTYQETLGQRHRVAGLQSTLALAGAPMNAEQSKAVLDALIEDQRRQQNAFASTTGTQAGIFVDPAMQSADMDRWLAEQERWQERLLTSLESVLTSEQLEHLKQNFANEREMQRASSQLARARGAKEEVIFTEAAPAFGFASSESDAQAP